MPRIARDTHPRSTIYICKFCDRYFVPPSGWMRAELESKELLSICLKKMKPQLLKVRLTDARFVWTEVHSKRIKVKLTIQKEVFTNTILQQTFIVEFTVHNQMCDDCRRAEAKDFWRACVQVRQKAEFKKTLFYLEQLLLKHGAHSQCTGVKPVPTGIDFFFAKLQDARKFVDFLMTVLPCRYHYAQELVSHDTKNNTYDYKHTFCVEIVHICRDNIVCMPKKVAQQLGNMSQIAICLRVSNVITLIDPNNLQMADIQATTFWRDPFDSLCTQKQLSEFYVLDVERVDNLERKAGHGFVSKKHVLADVWLVRSHQVGMSDAQTLSTRTHLGHLLNAGDLVLAFDIRNCNVNNSVFDEMKPEDIPDVVIVKKVYDRARRAARRQWKLKRLVVDGNIVGNETESVADEFQRFIEDVEEDPYMREKINIYKLQGFSLNMTKRRCVLYLNGNMDSDDDVQVVYECCNNETWKSARDRIRTQYRTVGQSTGFNHSAYSSDKSVQAGYGRSRMYREGGDALSVLSYPSCSSAMSSASSECSFTSSAATLMVPLAAKVEMIDLVTINDEDSQSVEFLQEDSDSTSSVQTVRERKKPPKLPESDELLLFSNKHESTDSDQEIGDSGEHGNISKFSEQTTIPIKEEVS
ncbi:NMD3 family protein [Necator americanus]|uniref:60S ribosomal export protein NMD3 n=1 Tax=Necator americanus TaxID=51031 RepID=W2SJ09_NECAM|nr:NMD3 family protein [Necator americanus]ETN68841.1 NMD3 family protein [Necator americanus]